MRIGRRTRRPGACASNVGNTQAVAVGVTVGWAVADGSGVNLADDGADVAETGPEVAVATCPVGGGGGGVLSNAKVWVAQAEAITEIINHHIRRMAQENSRETKKCRMMRPRINVQTSRDSPRVR